MFNIINKTAIFIISLLVIAVAVGSLGYYIWKENQPSSMPAKNVIIVSTTTSLYQIGVLDDLFDSFNNLTYMNISFNVLAKGSGEALRLLADGSACIGFVHAPSLELQYMNQGKIERLAIFGYNEFILVGPKSDPANVSQAPNVIEAFKRIYEAGERGDAKFVSRADLSGTNVRELQIWNLTKLNLDGKSWYLKSGQGMSQTLLMADNLNAYTLTDIGTYLKLAGQNKFNNLVILKKDPLYLINVYSMYLSKSSNCDNPNTWYIAYKFKDFLMDQGQQILETKYKGLVDPAKGSESMLQQAWETLASLG